MLVDDLVERAKDAMTVRRVYGDPVERDGLTLIPAAAISGAFGGGSGTDSDGQQGEGAGGGVNGRPTGAFVVRDGQVSWRPAVDVNRLVGVLGLVVATYLVVRPRLIRARRAT